MAAFKRFLSNESGSTAIEYALIAAMVAVVIIVGLRSVGTALKTGFYEPFGQAIMDANASSTGN